MSTSPSSPEGCKSDDFYYGMYCNEMPCDSDNYCMSGKCSNGKCVEVEESESSNVLLIVGCIVGALLLLVAAFILYRCARAKAAKKKQEQAERRNNVKALASELTVDKAPHPKTSLNNNEAEEALI